MQGHILADDPANNNQERGNTQSNLNAGANRNTHSQIHLVPDRNHHGRDMLRRIAHNRDQYQTDEVLAYTRALDDVVDAADQVLGADSDEEGGHDEDACGGNGAECGRLLGVLLGDLVLGVEEVAVGLELEDEVQNVEAEQDDGGSAGEDEDAAVLLLLVAVRLVEDGVELNMVRIRKRCVSARALTAAGRTREAEDRVIMEQVV